MMHMSVEDTEMLERFTVELFAAKLDIQVPVQNTVADILSDIIRVHSDIGDSIERFFLAYRNWFDFHRRIEEADRVGNMVEAEQTELIRLGQEKHDARNALLQLNRTL